MKTIEEIYAEAEKFVKEKFGAMRSNEERITILSIMKQLVDLQGQEIELKKLERDSNKLLDMVKQLTENKPKER